MIGAPDVATETDNQFKVEVRTSGTAGNEVPLKGTIDDLGYVMAGMLRARAGSGKMATNNEVVEAGSRNQDFTLTYTADTPLTDDVDTTAHLPAAVNLQDQGSRCNCDSTN